MSLENILSAEKSGSFTAVQSALMEYYTTRKDLTFQDIEKELRRVGCSVFLVARSRRCEGDKWVSHADGQIRANFPQKMKFMDLRTKKETKHFLWVTTKQGAALMAEVLEESSSYAENLAKLGDCGMQVLDCNEGDIPAPPSPAGKCVRCAEPEKTFCSVCEGVNYCSATCRRADWSFHRKECQTLRSLPDAESKLGRDRTIRSVAIEKKYNGYLACCQSGNRDFHNGADMVCVTRNGRKVTVCEECLARVGVTNRERVNKVHTRVVGNVL